MYKKRAFCLYLAFVYTYSTWPSNLHIYTYSIFCYIRSHCDAVLFLRAGHALLASASLILFRGPSRLFANGTLKYSSYSLILTFTTASTRPQSFFAALKLPWNFFAQSKFFLYAVYIFSIFLKASTFYVILVQGPTTHYRLVEPIPGTWTTQMTFAICSM